MYQENQYQEEYDDIHVQSGVRAENGCRRTMIVRMSTPTEFAELKSSC